MAKGKKAQRGTREIAKRAGEKKKKILEGKAGEGGVEGEKRKLWTADGTNKEKEGNGRGGIVSMGLL